jgi:hypothetical protein
LAQIEDGVTANLYIKEGQLIMKEVNAMLENIKDGNYNNYVGNNGNQIAGQNVSIMSNNASNDGTKDDIEPSENPYGEIPK